MDIISFTYILIIMAIIITGGYKGSLLGIYVSARSLLNPIIILLSSIALRYLLSRDDLSSSISVKFLINIRSYLLNASFRNLFIAVTLFLIIFKLLQHYSYHTYACDLSLFDYPIHYTLKGQFMYSPWWSSLKNFFGIHFWPILTFIVPFYLIYDSPIILLILQGIFTSLALIPITAIAKENGFDREDRIYIGIFYIFNLFLWRGFEYNFHIEILYPLFLFFAFYTAFKQRFLLHTIFILLTLSIKEDAFFHCIMLEAFFFVFNGNRRIALLNIMLSLIWGFFTLKFALPYLRPEEFANIFLIDRYGHLGSNYTEIILYVISHPLEMCRMIFRVSLLRFILSFGFLPLLHLKLSIFGFPSLLIHLFTNFPPQFNLKFYHALPAIPFFVISSIFVLKKVDIKWRKRLLLLLVIISLSSFRTPGWLIPTPADIRAHFIFANFNTEEVISAQANIFPHLPRSANISIYPNRINDAKYIMLKLNRRHATIEMTKEEYYKKIIELIDEGNYRIERYFYPYVILRREKRDSRLDDKMKQLREDVLKIIKNR